MRPSLALANLETNLQAAVYADPASDAPRLVYCDWLLEQNDPRGELMVLQFARKTRELTEEEAAQETELIEAFGSVWLGPLATAVAHNGLRFDRGFVASAEVRPEEELDPGAMEHPAWSTLTEMRRGVPPSASSSEMPLLRSIREISNRDVVRLAERTGGAPLANVDTLSWSGPLNLAYGASSFDRDGCMAIDAFERIDCLPSLRTLSLLGQNSWSVERGLQPTTGGINASLLRWSWKAPVSARLEELQFPAPLRLLPDLLAALTPTSLKRVVINTHGGSSAGFGTLARLSRDATGAFSRLEIHHRSEHYSLNRFLSNLNELPSDLLTHLTLVVGDDVWRASTARRRLRTISKRQRRLEDVAIQRV